MAWASMHIIPFYPMPLESYLEENEVENPGEEGCMAFTVMKRIELTMLVKTCQL
jgi:ArsR family metal-binding transcriptional regulator